MRKSIYILIGISLISCFNQKHKEAEQIINNSLNIYDFVYLDMIKRGGHLTIEIINLDSLITYLPEKDKTTLLLKKGKVTFKELEYAEVHDKTNLKSNLFVSDSIRNILKNKSSKQLKAKHSFSEPFYLSQNRILLFQHIYFLAGSESEYALFYSKDKFSNLQISDRHHFGTYRLKID